MSNQPDTSNDMVFLPMGGMGGGSLPLPSRSDRADLIDKIKPEYAVEMLRHKFLGEELINGKWVAIPQLANQKLTDVGAWEICNMLSGIGNSPNMISLNDLRGINLRAKNMARAVLINCVGNWVRYGIKSKAQLYYIHEIVFSVVFAVLKQASGGSIQELLKATVSENRNITQERKEGIGSRLKRALGLGGGQ